MWRGNLFWGVILVLAGGLLLLDNLGVIRVNVWNLIWPLFLIALGFRALAGGFFRRRGASAEQASIPLEGAASARVRISHGAGRLEVYSGAGPDVLASGTFGGGLDFRSRRSGETQEVDMRIHNGFSFPWLWGEGRRDWSFGLNGSLPLSLEFKTGASESRLDLSGLKMTDLRLETGASDTRLTLPAAAGQTRARVQAGAASIEVMIPDGVAAKVKVRGGLYSANVDTARFPKSGDAYRSPDYETAANRVDLEIEAGAGSVKVY